MEEEGGTLGFFRSRKLTIVLLLSLAVLSMAGTIHPPERAGDIYLERFGPRFMPAARALGLVDTYRSPFFIALIALFCTNITVCTWHRAARRWGSAAGVAGVSRRRLKLGLDIVMHTSILVILAGGAAKGIGGSVVTRNLHVGLEADTMYDWRLKGDVPLGFTVKVHELEEEYFPFRARIGVSDAVSGEKLALLGVTQGTSTPLPGGSLHLEALAFDRDSLSLSLAAKDERRQETLVLEAVQGGRSTADFPPYRITLVAYRDDLKMIGALLSILTDGRTVSTGWIRPNSPLHYHGTGLSLTSWGTDQYGSRFVGIQASRDPGALLFWSGSILFILSLPGFLYLRHARN